MNFRIALTVIFVALLALTCTAGAAEIAYDLSGIPDSPAAGTQYIVPVTVTGDVTGYTLKVLYDTNSAKIDFRNTADATTGGRPGARKIVSADGTPDTFDLLITPLSNATITLNCELAGDIPCSTHDEIKFVFGGSAPTPDPTPTTDPSPIPDPTPTTDPSPIPDPTPTTDPSPIPDPTADPTPTIEPTTDPASGSADLTPTGGRIDWGTESIEVVDGAASIPVVMTGADRVAGITVALKNVSGADVTLNKTGSALFKSGTATRLSYYSANGFTNSDTVSLYTIDITGISEGSVVSFDLEYKISAAGRDQTLDYTESNPVSVSFTVGGADDTYTVTLPSADEQIGYTIAPADGSSSPVADGGNFTFTFALDDAYSESDAVIKINGEELVTSIGEYTIENITGNVTVTVENVTINTYKVALPPEYAQIGYTIAPADGSSSPVAYGGNYTFTFTLDDAYSDACAVIKINGEELVMTGNEYTIENITGYTNVTVENVTINTYTVTLPSAEEQIGYTIAAADGSSSPVSYGGNYTFTFALDDAYSDSAVVIKINGEELITDDDVPGAVLRLSYPNLLSSPMKQYTIENITGDVVVTVEGVTINTYTVTLPSEEEQIGYTIAPADGSSSPVAYGDNYTFTFVLDDAYAGADAVIMINGEEITMIGDEYTIENITEDQIVTVGSITVSTCDVILPSADEQIGYTIEPAEGSESPVAFGGNYTFTFSLDEAYSDSEPIIKINGEELVMTGNTYTIENITGDVTVTVENVTINMYTVTLPSVDEQIGYSLTPAYGSSSPVTYGGEYSFLFVPEDPSAHLIVKINGEAVIYANGPYTIEDITGNITLTVESVSLPMYNVTLPSADEQIGYTIAAADGSESPVEIGGIYTFVFSLDDAYTDSEAVIKVNGEEISLSDGRYTIENISEDKVVTVENVTINMYNVTLPEDQARYTVRAADGSSSPVVYGGSFTFTVEHDILPMPVIIISINDEKIYLQDGLCTIENITEDKVVTIVSIMEDTDPETFTVTYSGADYVPDPSVVEDGAEYTVSDDRAISSGKVFRGWAAGDNVYGAGDRITITENIVLVAEWYTPQIDPTGADIINLNNALHGENPDQYTNYDMNGDGHVTITDLILMAQYVADKVAVSVDVPEEKITWNTSSVVFDNGSASIPVIMTDAYRIQGMRVYVTNVTNANVTLNGTESPIFAESGSVIVYFTPGSGYTNEGTSQIFSIDITDAVAGSDVTFTLNFDVTSNAKNVTSSYIRTPAVVKLTVPGDEPTAILLS